MNLSKTKKKKINKISSNNKKLLLFSLVVTRAYLNRALYKFSPSSLQLINYAKRFMLKRI